MGKSGEPPPQDPEIPLLKSQLTALEQQLAQQMEQFEAALKASETTTYNKLESLIDSTTAQLSNAIKALESGEGNDLNRLHETIQSELIAVVEQMKLKEEEDLASLRADVEKQAHDAEEKTELAVDELMRGIEGSHNLLTGQIRETAEKAHCEVVEAKASEHEELSNEVTRLDATIKSVNKELIERCDSLQKHIDELNQRLDNAKSVMQKADENLAAACEAKFDSLEQHFRDKNENGHESFESIKALEAKITPYLETMQHTAWTLDNMYTRTVTWQIKGFRQKLAQLLEQKERVLQSPPFSICAQSEMCMDMLAAPEEEPSVPGIDIPPLPTAGSCSIRIWAPPGYRLGIRLVLGDDPNSITVRRDCIFEAGEVMDAKGRSSFQLKNLCQLDQIWNKKRNIVSVTLEVLELRYGDEDDVEADLNASDAAASKDGGLTDAHLEAAAAENDKVYADKVLAQRSLTSDSLIQERMQSQLQVIRNRNVRRVEWRLEGCSRLLEVLKAGEAVDSPFFSAAGIDKMQIHFYPHGCEVGDKASNHGPPCAVYVSGPYRTTLRGILSVGSNSRQFEQRYQRRGDVGGRGKFCSLESQMDMHDAVTLALEVVEVETDLPDMNSALLFRQARAPGPMSPSGGNTSHAGGAKGSLRRLREDPAKTEEVVRCISLPSLNTRQQFLPKVAGSGHKAGIRSR